MTSRLVWPSRRRVREALHEHPLLFAVGACYVAWRLWHTLPSPAAEEEEDASIAWENVRKAGRGRRPSLELTNERGDLRGALDPTESGWGWQVQEAPFAPKASGGSVLRQESSEKGGAKKRTVRFQLDASQDFYGFVYEYSGRCVAHGADPSFVGLTLREVLERTENTRLDGEELHKRFVAAAEAGGGWVSYEWRNNANVNHVLRGAFIIKISKWGRDFYAGVGYSVLAPQASHETGKHGAQQNLYGFIFDCDGVCVAHGASRSFVGKTLGQILELTENTQLNADDLLARFIDAATSGGGWVRYPWRNAADEPLRMKGAFVSTLERHTTVVSNCDAMTDEQAAVDTLLKDAASFQYTDSACKSAIKERSFLCMGFGYFGNDGSGGATGSSTPTQVPPSPAAAKAATAELKRQLGCASEWDDLAPLQAIMHDRSGRLAACAAEAHCWDAIELPSELGEALREHTCLHIGAFDSPNTDMARSGSEQFGQSDICAESMMM